MVTIDAILAFSYAVATEVADFIVSSESKPMRNGGSGDSHDSRNENLLFPK